jgi:ActR/RegA family two-component response regulator
MKAYKILVVEDDEDIVETVRYCLEVKGFVVDVAYDGLSALRMARKNHYDLMLLDIMLPGKNGEQPGAGGFPRDVVESGRVHVQAVRDGRSHQQDRRSYGTGQRGAGLSGREGLSRRPRGKGCNDRRMHG